MSLLLFSSLTLIDVWRPTKRSGRLHEHVETSRQVQWTQETLISARPEPVSRKYIDSYTMSDPKVLVTYQHITQTTPSADALAPIESNLDVLRGHLDALGRSHIITCIVQAVQVEKCIAAGLPKNTSAAAIQI